MLAKLSKLKKLLNVDENHISILGLLTDEERKPNEIKIEDFSRNDDLEFLFKDKKKGVKKIDNFEVGVFRNNKNDSIEPPSPFFPKIPFAMYILGQVKAGKSTLLRSILPLYMDAFDKVFFLSPTFNLDPEAIDLLDTYPDVEAYGDINVLEVIITKMTKINKGKDPAKKVKCLVILDDMIADIYNKGRKDNGFIKKCALNRRHIGISFVILSQHFRLCPVVLRANFSSFAIFRLENMLEKKKVIEELSGFLGKKKFEDVFDKATEEPYNFLSINFDANDKKYQYTRNFDEIIITDADFNNNKIFS